MYTVLWLCRFRPKWYDLPPFHTLKEAIIKAEEVCKERRTTAVVHHQGIEVYRVDR